MAGGNNRDFERRVDAFFTKCEWVLLRTLVFACFAYEVCRFAWWLWRM